ncbi:MAG: hypothetical protein BMS9Abin26_0538 [Gammaproteobacteria bacterium]|nr:MAG: hypothetical protein BMS9Abin26_0538 [Gammaproteobacteria bacterium]
MRINIKTMFLTATVGISAYSPGLLARGAEALFEVKALKEQADAGNPCLNMQEFTCAVCGNYMDPEIWAADNYRYGDKEACERYKQGQKNAARPLKPAK